MDFSVINEFSFFCWLTGVPAMAVGILYKLQPPQKRQWYHGIQLKAAWRSEATWKAAHQFAAIPILVLGLVLTLAGFLPFLFSEAPLFTYRSAFVLIAISLILLKVMIEKYINTLYDANGEIRSTDL